MKKNLFLIAMAIISVASAYAQDAKFIFNYSVIPLDKTPVTTGILLEKTMSISNMGKFDGIYDTIASVAAWEQMYYEIHNAALDSTEFPDLDSLYKLVMAKLQENIVPIVVLDVEYNTFKSYALTNSLISFDSISWQWNDVLPRAESPYQSKKVLAVAPAQSFFANDTIVFILDTTFIFSNQPLPTAVQVDFGNGAGWQNITLGTPYTIVYPDSGQYTITVDITHGGQTSRAKTGVDLIDFPKPDLRMEISSTGTNPWSGKSNAGRAYVKYGKDVNGNPHTCIKKPLIFVEGIDYGTMVYTLSDPISTETILDLDILHQYKYGDFGWPEFVTGGLSDLFLNNFENPYEELVKLPLFISGAHNSSLGSDGYDIILLDFKDGADYIERNAMVFVKLIEWLRDDLCGDEEIVVVAASMGGQVARYGLSWMEKNNAPHCTRLSISFDSPHQGANIPLGIQYTAKAFAGLDASSKKAWDRKLQRPASQEMLYVHAESYGSNLIVRDNYINAMNSLGYPKKLRKVAITNSSLDATSQGFSAGALLWEYDHKILSRTILHANAWALPGTTGNKVFEIQNLSFTYGYCSSSTPHYDNAPGSRRGDLKDLGKMEGATNHEDWFCFMPSLSTLDINSSNLNLNVNANLPNHNVSDPLYSFEAYEGPSTGNERHVEVTSGVSPENSNNILFSLSELRETEYPLPGTLTDAYVFGNLRRRKLHDLTLNSGGVIWVNKDGYTGYDTDPDISVSASGTFTVRTTTCGADIILNSGSYMEIGDDVDDDFKGEIIIDKYSTLTLNSGSTLRIHNGSKLIIEDGASLVFNSGASIELDGSNAAIDIRGSLHLGQGATFTYSGTGFVEFHQEYPPATNVFADGTSAAIELSGSGSSDVILRVSGGEAMSPEAEVSVSITDGMVEMEDGCRLNISGDLFMNNVEVDLSGSGAHRGIHTYGQENITLDQVTIKHGSYGLYAYSYDAWYRYAINIYCSNFEANEKGIFSHAVPLQMESSHAKENTEYGIKVEAAGNNDDHYLLYCEVNQNADNGMEFTSSSSGTVLELINSVFSSNGDNGVDFSGNGTLQSGTTKFETNSNSGIKASGGTLVLGPYNTGPVVGNNIFTGNVKGVEMNGVLLSIYDGQNEFVINQTIQSAALQLALEGEMTNAMYLTCAGMMVSATKNDIVCSGTCTTLYQVYELCGTPTPSWQPSTLSLTAATNQPTIIMPSCSLIERRGREGEGELMGENSRKKYKNGYYWSKALNNARDQHYSDMVAIGLDSFMSDSMYLSTIDILSRVLLSSNSEILTENRDVTNVAYNKMMQSVGKVIHKWAEGKINSGNMAQACRKAEQVQQYLIFNQAENYADSLKYYSDYAILLRDQNKYQDAISAIDNMLPWVKPKDQAYMLQWRCWTETEEMVKNGKISRDDAVALDRCHHEALAKTETSDNNSTIAVPQNKRDNSIMRIYPSPATDELKIQLPDAENITITITDITGKTILQKRETGHNIYKLPLQSLSNGIYNIEVQSATGNYRDKFIISR